MEITSMSLRASHQSEEFEPNSELSFFVRFQFWPQLVNDNHHNNNINENISNNSKKKHFQWRIVGVLLDLTHKYVKG